ncbi:MAG: hypothetical protein HY706_03930 [Candidatus Hydrogenedentes bacterium]|nr:hypothetical protein [Candidatus Hydrogenedentota bacterium]
MHHVKLLSRCKPVNAQLETVLQFVGLLNSLLGLLGTFAGLIPGVRNNLHFDLATKTKLPFS